MTDGSEDAQPLDEQPEPPKAEWQHRTFKINEKMVEVVNLGIKTTEIEIASLKRKLSKLQYGA
jgi:hypothetical protein